MKKLQLAFSRKEKAERLLANLEDLKKEGIIGEHEYNLLKAEYTAMLEKGTSEIQKTKDEIKGTLDVWQRDLVTFTQELRNLEVRIKVGELTGDKYKRLEQQIKGKIEKLQRQIENFQKLLAAESSAHLGGFIDVPVKERSASQALAGAWKRLWKRG